MSKRIGVMLLGLIGASLFGLVSVACAQLTVPAVGTHGSTDKPSDQSGTETILQQDEDGNWQLVPLDSLKSNSNQSNPGSLVDPSPDVPDFFISKLELEGTANEEWVDLTASIFVHIVTPDRWFEVPLRFDQAALLDYEYIGEGDNSAPASDENARGLSWLFRGGGDHRLEMKLRVPLRRTSTGDLLQLELPEMSYFTGKLSLRLPSNSVTIRPQGSVKLMGTQIEGEETLVRAELPGDRVDLRWNIIEQQAQPLMKKPTQVRLRFLDDEVELSARQWIQLSNPDELRVRMPTGDFELTPQGVQVIDSDGTSRWVHPKAEEVKTPDDQPNWVTIPLDVTKGTPEILDWRFSAPMPREEQEILIDGFEIADVRQQTGTIEIERPNGLRIGQIDEESIAVERMDVEALQNSMFDSSLAYSFSGGQFRLRLQIEPTDPIVSVTPYFFVKVSQDRVELEAIYRLSIEGGVVSRLPIFWPGNDDHLWEVSPSQLARGQPRKLRSTAAHQAETADQDRSSEWEMTLPDVDDSRVDVGLFATRYFENSPPHKTLELNLPTLSAIRASSGWVVVSTDDDVEVETRGGTDIVLNPQADSALEALNISQPKWTQLQPNTVFRFSTEHANSPLQLKMELTVRSQSVATSTEVKVRNLDGQPQVSQRLSYDVQFGRLSRIRLKIPQSLYRLLPQDFPHASLTFMLEEQPLTQTEWTDSEVTITLPSARIGKFDVVVSDYSPQQGSQESGVATEIPIITSMDAPLSTTKLVVPDQETLSIRVEDPKWTKLSLITDGLQWMTDEPVSEVAIQVDPSVEHSPQSLTISSAILQTAIDNAGNRVTRGTFVINEPVDELALKLPSDAVIQSFQCYWNERQLSGDDLSMLNDSREVRIRLPINQLSHKKRLGRHYIQIKYQSLGMSINGSELQRVQFPQFPPRVWIEHLWWELSLPSSQHLFFAPTTMTPQFQWIRDGIFWTRKPNATYEAMRKSLLEGDLTQSALEDDAKNVYPFTSYASPREVSFRTTSMSVIVFLGSGLTLFASFLLLKVPAARHPVLWLAVAIGILSLSLWYLQPMLLLLQPAAYGLVLPVCAAMLEYLLNGRRLVTRSPTRDTTYRELGPQRESGLSDGGDLEITSPHVQQPVMSDSGIDH